MRFDTTEQYQCPRCGIIISDPEHPDIRNIHEASRCEPHYIPDHHTSFVREFDWHSVVLKTGRFDCHCKLHYKSETAFLVFKRTFNFRNVCFVVEDCTRSRAEFPPWTHFKDEHWREFSPQPKEDLIAEDEIDYHPLRFLDLGLGTASWLEIAQTIFPFFDTKAGFTNDVLEYRFRDDLSKIPFTSTADL